MAIVVETRWRDTLTGELYGGSTHQVVDDNLHASQKLDDAVAMAKRMTSGHEVAFVRNMSIDHPQAGKATS